MHKKSSFQEGLLLQSGILYANIFWSFDFYTKVSDLFDGHMVFQPY